MLKRNIPKICLTQPVKSFTTDDGKDMKIYGTEDDGYRVKVNGKESKKSFGKLDDAVLACETFVQRSRDYASEKIKKEYTMKINEVAMREAEPNYEVDPAQARLAAIALNLWTNQHNN